ncbi:MAG: TRAP transporter permease [Alphaproteobacteria bacterium]|nr:TRAP transporter permease [Alphaproteobacteria bacterium]
MTNWYRPSIAIPGIIALAMAAFHLWVVFRGAPEVFVFRGTHLLFGLVLIFLWYPTFKSAEGTNYWVGKAIDALLLIISVVALGYIFVEHDYILDRFAYVDEPHTIDYVLGIGLIIAVLEGTRRLVGLALPITAVLFIIYGLFVVQLRPGEFLDQMYLTTEGLFGIPIAVSATYMVLFIVFGSLVERTGTGKLFMDFAMSLTGSAAGGPAKVAVMTSAMFGTISGSSTANVMTTGTFTIPLMNRLGYRRPFSGAVEAVASTGGQIMPPIMGAAAFVMAEFLAVSYLTVIMLALIPALLYFLAVFVAVHFEAKRLGLKGLPKPDLPHMKTVLTERGHQFLPLLIIVAALVAGFSAPYAATCGLLSVVPIALLRRTTRAGITVGLVADAVIQGIRNSLQVVAACACAGIVIGVIAQGGIGVQFSNFVIELADNTLILALVLTAVAGIVLGMGLPTTPAYIVQVALLVPALVKLGVQVEAAHMFVLYFACLSAITPPVAITLYAANSISGAGLWSGGIAAMKLAATGYIIPFMFVFGPPLLMIGSWDSILLATLTATLGVTLLAAGLHGYLIAMANWWERLLMVGAAVVLIKPGIVSDLLGLAILCAVIASQRYLQRPAKLAEATRAEVVS